MYLPTKAEPTGTIVKVVTGKFVPTVVWPTTGKWGILPGRVVFYGHILWWVLAVVSQVLIGIMGPTSFLKPPDTPTGDDYTVAVPANTTTIGIMGFVTTLLGVIALLAAASVWDAEDYKGVVWANAIIFTLTTFGLVCAFYITCEAFTQPNNVFVVICCVGMFFLLHSQMFLFATASTLEVTQLPRIMVPALLFSFNLVSAIAMNDVDGAGASWTGFTDHQKALAYVNTFLGAAVLILSALLRRWINMGKADSGGVEGLDVTKLVNHPGKRSVLMTVVFVNAITQTYICGLTTGVAYLFQFPATILVWLLTGIILNPDTATFGKDDLKEALVKQ